MASCRCDLTYVLSACTAVGLVCLASADERNFDAERLLEIGRINSLPNMLWKAGENSRFKGMPVGASRHLCGVKPGGRARLRELVTSGEVQFVARQKDGARIPERFEAAEKWSHCSSVIEDVRDQSACGCCWAFGAAEAASDRLCIYSNGSVALPLSAQELCFCAEANGCNGGDLQTAWNYIQTHGLVTGGQYQGSGACGSKGLCSSFSLPHCHHHGPPSSDPYPPVGGKGCPTVSKSPQCPRACDASAKVPFNDFARDRYAFKGAVQHLDWDADTIATDLLTHGPVEAAFAVYSDFEFYLSGIYHATSSVELGLHAVKIVGWGVENDVKYWRVQNSWNKFWGEKGFFRIKRGTNECGIEEQVVSSSGTSTWHGPGLAPAPPPPPMPGNCWEEETEQSCTATEQEGSRCKWCPADGGLCETSDSICSSQRIMPASIVV